MQQQNPQRQQQQLPQTGRSSQPTTPSTNAHATTIDIMGAGGDGHSLDSLPPLNFATDRYPCCIVWTPIPVLTWIFPFIGHMGICMSNGIIRDFAGPYFVSENDMGFGRPTRYLQLDLSHVAGGRYEWDEAVSKASVLYGTRMHNLFCDNCHSHVATALIAMRYKKSTSWNMVILACWMFVCGRYVGVWGFIKTWLPFGVLVTICVLLGLYF